MLNNKKGFLLIDMMLALLLASIMVFMFTSAYQGYIKETRKESERHAIYELVQEGTRIHYD